MNIVINVTYLISGIYTNVSRLLYKKCDVGYYVINHGVRIFDVLTSGAWFTKYLTIYHKIILSLS